MIWNARQARVLGTFVASAALALGSLSLAGCASVVWLPRVDAVPGEYRSTQSLAEKAEEMPEGATTDVKAIYMVDMPPGLQMADGVLRYDPNEYEMLGKVSARPSDSFFYPYREGWRRPFCYPQQVLLIATAFIWLAVPAYWPCLVAGGPESEQRDWVVEALKRATKAMGGNLVLIRGFETTSPGVWRGSAQEGFGYAFKIKERPPAPAPASPGVTL
jgi:hypothetical protein